MKRFFAGFLVATLGFASGVVHAELPNEDLMCRPDEPRMDKFAYLRALSLDVRGDVPTSEEYADLATNHADVPETLIENWLSSEAFVNRAVRAHRSLLWNNLESVRLGNYRQNMRRIRATNGEYVYYRDRQAAVYRHNNRPPCDVDRQVEYDSSGLIITRPKQFVRAGETYSADVEGYIEISPYWAPQTTIRVCAFDAQTPEVSSSGIECSTNAGFNDTGCGCGPNLVYCNYANQYGARDAFAKEVEYRIADVIRENRPYTDLFTSRRAYVNGPMIHFYKYHVGFTSGTSLDPVALDISTLPDIPYTDYNYYPIELPAEHAGILTSPSFLLRFQTNRARANRFFDAFLCSPPSPPSGGLPAQDPNARIEPDLQLRDGCKYCHALLEPAAAHWGRWTERGSGFLPENTFPSTRADCEECGRTGQACSNECRLFYVTQAYSPEEEAYIGMLNAYQWMKPNHQQNVELGPKFLVLTSIVDARFPNCTSKRALEAMLGREVNASELLWAKELSKDFLNSGYRYRDLVKAIVTSDLYRRIR
jgi:hypothetical protein